MTLGAFTQFTDSGQAWTPQVLMIIAGFAAMQILFHTIWCAAGDRIASVVAGTPIERVLMVTLGVLMLATIVWATLR